MLPPGCEPRCHGCRHRGLDMASSHAQKQGYLARVLGAWSDRLQPLRAAAKTARLGYRERVTLTAAHDEASGWRFGLMRRDELIAIHDCPVHDPGSALWFTISCGACRHRTCCRLPTFRSLGGRQH